MKKYIIALLLFISTSIYSQSNFQVDGFLQYLETVTIPKQSDKWITYSSISNRLDFRWYPTGSLTAHVGMRNILDYGEFVSLYPGYAKLVTQDNGYLDLTALIDDNTSYVLYSNFDRLNLQYTSGNFDITLGRQRVNWGVNLVWTPNDIFNSFSYLNFDYIERPGSDAFKIQYYTSTTSSLQLVGKIDNNEKVSAAAMYRFNKSNYDYQFFAGVMEDDYTLGGGWSGDLNGAGFNGEFSYFHTKENFGDTTGVFVASLGVNYTFASSLYLHGTFLYNGNGKTGKVGGLYMYNTQNFSAKNLSLGKYEFFTQASYEITPLIKGNLAIMLNPSDGSFFLGPNVDFSLNESIYFLFMTQLFYGESNTEYGNLGRYFYLRLKWNF